jgi:Tol biopolymer transport system component
MAHHSYPSPDGRWLLVVEMDSRGQILPCRIVPFHGPGEMRVVGLPNSPCFAGAWSVDGKWIYLSVTTGESHIWRQRFPSGELQQIIFGPTSQEGIAMAPDGKSFITSVGSQDTTVWLHNKNADHQISSEGNASAPSFSSDGNSLYFLMINGQSRLSELWMKDLSSGKMDRVLPGYSMNTYSVSRDGKQVAFTANDPAGHPRIWVAPMNRRSSPVRISSTEVEDSPQFLPDGDLVFRAVEGGSNFLYRMKTDGSARSKITGERVLDLYTVSPDGQWVTASAPISNQEHTAAIKAFRMGGNEELLVCALNCLIDWDTSGKFVFFTFQKGNTYALPLTQPFGLPRLPPAGVSRVEDFPAAKTALTIPNGVDSAISPSFYAYTRQNTRRNLYRIQLQ